MRADPGRSAWRIAGRCCAAAGWLGWIVVQAVAKDPFPPEISVSQYGIGPTGWILSVWAIVLAGSPLLLLRYRPVPGPARRLLAVGGAGAVLMALVRTDEGIMQMTIHAKAHMAGAVLALVFLPLGICSALRYATRRWWWTALAFIAAGSVAGALLLLAAIGLDTAGLGPAGSWAFWQGVLIIIEMLLVGLYALTVTTIDPRAVRAGGVATVQSAAG